MDSCSGLGKYHGAMTWKNDRRSRRAASIVGTGVSYHAEGIDDQTTREEWKRRGQKLHGLDELDGAQNI